MLALTDTAAPMAAVLADWTERGWLRPIDGAFAAFLRHEMPDAPPLLILAAALASHQLGRGHVCLDLAATLADPAFALSLPPDGAEPAPAERLPGAVLRTVTLEAWLAALRCEALVGHGDGASPLVLVGHRLYLRRYWQYEQAVRQGIDQRLRTPVELPEAPLRQTLAALFPPPAAGTADWQRLACALAARSAFSIVTGGPGTGKTTTVVRLLALLQALALADPARPRALRIRLAAPTGKAAARLNASIAGAVAGLPLAALAHGEAIREAIPRQVTTLHRLLGSRPDTRRFRHHPGNPLALDVLVIDEASMVDLEMMATVLAALPPRARLVLLGDKDQLASVEAGAVLGELCARAAAGHYTPATAAWLAQAAGGALDTALIDPAGTPLDQAIAMLRVSHRFHADSGIGQLAQRVNDGDVDGVEALWRQGAADLARLAGADCTDAGFRALVIEGGGSGDGDGRRRGYRHYLDTLRTTRPALTAGPEAFDAWAQQVLDAHAAFQLLCALRRGPWGVAGLNPRIATALHEAGLIAATEGWYAGRPVLVTRNDYGLGLMNGDIGIALEVPDTTAQGWTLRVAFPAGERGAGIKWVLPSRLQAVETVFALTVHKSQGSEFEHVALALPETPTPILTRELLYTGITRARAHFTLLSPGAVHVQRHAIEKRVQRDSGLMSVPEAAA
ncbi:exodeoxyribonuclease V subunit alpha [Denitromonas sp.]|uniref:exodeoxyribonuclease V subunit alpha n=1 Tax=Denitromonas sp. TaxID=2734609 RepID=UPI002B002EF3|nr:exodeoxyribonuclease V subunit alpha [Denitromonas sp.]